VAFDPYPNGQLKRAVGCYIFAGGFSIGMARAGFNITAHLEGGDYGVRTFKHNFPLTPVWSLKETWPVKALASDPPDLIYCNPPCAAWSVAGASLTKGKTQWLKDPRINCHRAVLELMKTVQPKVLMWESVTQAFSRGRSLVEDFTNEALRLGYAVTHLFTSAELHGIPQPRERYLFVASKVKLDLSHPGWSQLTTVQEALGLIYDREKHSWSQACPVWGEHPMSTAYSRLARLTVSSEGLRDAWKEVNEGNLPPPWDSQSPAFMAHRLSLTRGMTLTSAVFEVHPVFNRWLANSEVQALCGYPMDYQVLGTNQEVRAQLTQAVLPNVGEYLGERTLSGLLRGERPDHEVQVLSHLV
jgi:site-specific DNA-cytosine methylase